MKSILLPLLFSLLLIGCQEPPSSQPSQQSWSRTLTTESSFQQASQHNQLGFPADHGEHANYGIEWWYLTATLEDQQGQQYGIQWTLFRRAFATGAASGWQAPQLYMAHVAVSDQQSHYFAQKYARGGIGQAGVTSSPFSAWIDHWQLSSGSTARYPLNLSAASDEFSYQLTLNNQLPPFLQGQQGFSRKHGSGVGSHYYSEPFIQIAGTLEIAGKQVSVSGDAWLDHEWSSQFLSSEQLGWDWFALALDKDTRLMVFQLREQDGGHFRYARLMHSDGSQTEIAPQQVTLTPLTTTRLGPEQRQLPETWQLTIPASPRHAAIDLKVSMHHSNQWMATDFPYWEGMVKFSGSHNGRGYLEMTGY